MYNLAILIITIPLILFIGWKFFIYFQNSSDEFKAALIGVGGLVVVAIMSHHYASAREISARHFEQKTQAYTKVFDLWFEALLLTKINKAPNELELILKAMEIKKSLLIWANYDILVAWNEFEKSSISGNHYIVVEKLEDVIKLIRKDLGHDDPSTQAGELLKIIIIAKDKEKFMKNKSIINES